MTLLAVPVVVAVLAMIRTSLLQRRLALTGSTGVTSRQQWSFWSGIAAINLAIGGSTSPLAAAHPVTAHVVQFICIALIGVPLVLVSLPEWWVRQALAATRLYRTTRHVSRPLTAGLLANLVLLAALSPWTVGVPGAGAAASAGLVVVWLLGGVVLWLPVFTPIPEHRLPTAPYRGAYLLGAVGLTPMIPGELLLSARRVPSGGGTPDEHLAGGLLHLVAVPLVWLVIGTMWARAARAEAAADASRSLHPSNDRQVRSLRWRIDPTA